MGVEQLQRRFDKVQMSVGRVDSKILLKNSKRKRGSRQMASAQGAGEYVACWETSEQ